MTKTIFIAAYVLIFIAIAIFIVCPDATAAVYSSISGRVIAEDTGKGLANVTIVATLVGPSHKGYCYASTDATGVYVLTDLEPGTYLIGFYKENDFYVNEEPHVEVVLPKGKHVVNVNHVLTLGGSISGTVYQSDGTTPMAEVGVHASVSGMQQSWIDNSKYSATGVDGKFLLQGLPQSDNCGIEIMVPGHARMTKTVRITKGTVTANVNFTVKWDDVTGINGYIKSSVDGKPIKETDVYLRDSSGRDIGYARTDDTGMFSIVGVTPGAHDVVAFWPEGGGWIKKKNILIQSGKSIVVNFEFDKPAPTSRNGETLWEILYGLFVQDIFAQGGGGNPRRNFEGCGTSERDIIIDVLNAVGTFVRNFKPPNDNKCINARQREVLLAKMHPALTFKCIDVGCLGQGGLSIVGGTEIRLCPSFFEFYRDAEDRGNKCPESILLHELIHSIQRVPKNEKTEAQHETGKTRREKQAYACAEGCFPNCSKDDAPPEYDGGNCCD
jgi:hypothetical protein